jgi:class 3 adenylate cyclase
MKTEILAVMFTDIVGYTQRTSRQTYEENAALLKQHDAIVHPILKRFGGTVIKEIGDAVLATFTSPTRAVEAAMCVQDRLAELNGGRPVEEQLHLRIAINVGEVRLERHDVFGEGVNVAARIEAATPMDEIYVSGSTFLTMNRNNIPLEFLGQTKLKGIAEPVTLFSLPRFATLQDATMITTTAAVVLPYRGRQLSQLTAMKRRATLQLAALAAGLAFALSGGLYVGASKLWQSHKERAVIAAIKAHDFRAAAHDLDILTRHGGDPQRALGLVLAEVHGLAGTDMACHSLAQFAGFMGRDSDHHDRDGRERLYQALALMRTGELAQARECLMAVAFAAGTPESRLVELSGIHLAALAALRARSVPDLRLELKRYEEFLQTGTAPDEHLRLIAEIVADSYAFPKSRPVADSLVVDFLREKAAAALAKRAVDPTSPDTARMWLVARLEKVGDTQTLDWAAIYAAQLDEGLCTTRRAAIDGLKKLGKLETVGVLMRELNKRDRCTVAVAREAINDLVANADSRLNAVGHAPAILVAVR